MEQFNTLLEAVKFAVTRSDSWRFVTSNEKYNTKSLLTLAKIGDAEEPADEDSFYVVSPNGAIGFCQDGEDIDWLFMTSSGNNEVLPAKHQTTAATNFCPKCGSAAVYEARFCGACGLKLT